MSAPINLKLKVMSIKTLLKIDRVNLKLNLKHGGLLRFDDGVEVQYSKNEMVFLRYLLEPIVRLDLVNELKLTSIVDIKKYFINNRYTGKTINSIVSKSVDDKLDTISGATISSSAVIKGIDAAIAVFESLK